MDLEKPIDLDAVKFLINFKVLFSKVTFHMLWLIQVRILMSKEKKLIIKKF
jgi:hypothetical protein